MKLPSLPRPNVPVAATVKEIIDFLRASRIVHVKGGKLRETPNGTTLEINQGPQGKRATHPFKLSWDKDGSTIRLWVHYGLVDVPMIVEDSPGSWIITSLPRSPFMSNGSSLLLYDPTDEDASSAGFETLSASTTYGVWLKLTADAKIVDVVGQLSAAKGIGPASSQWYDDALITPYGPSGASSSLATIHIDSDYTVPGDASTIVANNTGFAYYYVGKVTVGTDRVTEILQYRKSDLIVPPVMLPLNFAISSDADNELLDGIDTGDGRVFYKAP